MSLGAFWGRLETFLDRLGALLGPSFLTHGLTPSLSHVWPALGLLGFCRALLGVLWSSLGPSGDFLGRSWSILGTFVPPSGFTPSLSHAAGDKLRGERLVMPVRIPPLGPILGPSWGSLGPSRGLWGRLRALLGVLGPSWGPHWPSCDDLGSLLGRLYVVKTEKASMLNKHIYI